MPKGSRVEIVNKEFNKRLVIIVITGKRTVVYLLILFAHGITTISFYL
jgi:hypothetical protein